MPQEELGRFGLAVGGYTLLIAALYLGVFHLIGGPILSRMNPWSGTVIFLGIPTVVDLAGSMLAALALPRLLDRISDRSTMLTGAALLALGTFVASVLSGLAYLLPLWFLLGMGHALAQTPAGRLLRRSAHPEDRPSQSSFARLGG